MLSFVASSIFAMPVSLLIALPSALVTAFLAWVAKRTGLVPVGRRAAWWILGSIMPALILGLGLRLSWPWPWHHSTVTRDGFPAEGFLFVAVLPSLLLCVLAARFILRRKRVPDA